MSIWDDLDLEQYAIMVIAKEEGYLNDVIGEYGMRLRWAKTGDVRLTSNLNEGAKRALIPKFSRAVAHLLLQGFIEVSGLEGLDQNDLLLMDEDAIVAALSDWRMWIDAGGDACMVMIATTDRWDQIAAPVG